MMSKTIWRDAIYDWPQKQSSTSPIVTLQIPTHRWKDLSMALITSLPILTDWKGDNYDLILVIVNRLMKIIYYKPIKITINALGFTEVIIDMIMRYHSFPDLTVTNRGLLFISTFWLLLCYFLGIKRRLSIAFYLQINGQTEKQNSTIEAYLRAFVKFEQNDWARLLPVAEFAYNNAKNVSTSYIPFEFNCRYHLCIFYEEDFDPCSKSGTIEKLSSKLRELMMVY